MKSLPSMCCCWGGYDRGSIHVHVSLPTSNMKKAGFELKNFTRGSRAERP